MRVTTRTKLSPAYYDWSWETKNPSGQRSGYGYELRSYSESRNVITSTSGNPKGDNPVDHWSSSQWIKPWSDSWKFPDGGSGSLRGFTIPCAPRFVDPGSPNWVSANAALLDDASGSFPASTSLPVNIAEAMSLKTLVPGLLSGFRHLSKKISRKSFKELAGSHLAYSFGLEPLLADTKDFFNLGKRIREKKAFINSNSFNPFRIAASANDGGASAWPLRGTTDIYYTYAGVLTRKWQGKATVSCDAVVVPWDDYSQNVRLLVGALGLNNPLGVMWELVPFSFVVDWFIPVGETLLTNPLIQNPRSIGSAVRSSQLSNFYHSYVSEVTEEYSATLSYNGSGMERLNSRPTKFACTNTYRHYYRNPGSPPADIVASWNPSWSLGRTALGVSLTAQRLLKSAR